MDNKAVLIVAASGRALAASARRGGYLPLVVDFFGDADTIALKEYEARHLPGMSMIILKGDDTLFEQGVGAVPVTRRRQSADGPDLACDQPKNQPCTLNTA